MALSLPEFFQKAQVNQLTPDELASELLAQYGIDMTSMGKTFSQMEEVFQGAPDAPSYSPTPSPLGGGGSLARGLIDFSAAEEPPAPEGYRRKTIPEELMEPVSQGAGLVGGAIGKATTLAKPFASEVLGIPVQKTPDLELMTKEIREARTSIDEDFTTRLQEPDLERLRLDIRDNLEGILELVNLLRVTDDYTKSEYGTAEHLQAQMEKGAETGGAMVTGAIADIGKMGDNFEEYFAVRPATTVMMVAPLLAELKGMAAAKYGPAMTAFADSKIRKAAGVIEKLEEELKKTKAGTKVARTVKKAGQAGGERWRGIKRLVSDPTIQATERASIFVDELMNEVRRTGDSIGAITKRWQESIKGGYESAIRKPRSPTEQQGLRLPVRKIEDAFLEGETPDKFTPVVERLKAKGIDIETNMSETSGKVLSQEYDYQPTAKHIGPSREAQDLIAEGLDLDDPSGWEKFVRSSDAEPVNVRIKNSNLAETVDRFIDDIVQVKGVDPIEAKKTFMQNFLEISVGALKSDIIKEEVIVRAMKALDEADFLSPEQLLRAEESLTRFLTEMNKREPSSKNYGNNAVINFGKKPKVNPETGRPYNVMDEGYGFDPVLELDVAKMVYDVMSDSDSGIDVQLLSRTGEDIANAAKREKTGSVLTKHMGSENTVSGWVNEHMPNLLEGGELPPAIPMNPNQIASFLSDTVATLAKRYNVDPSIIQDIGYRLRSYKRMNPEIADHFGLTDYLRKERPKLEGPDSKLSYEVFAPEGVNSTLKFEMDAYKAIREGRGFWNWLNSRIKGNITARNLASAINNVTGNFAYQTFRRGSPLLAAKLVQMAVEYNAWKKGSHKEAGRFSPSNLSDEKKSFFAAMERSGYLDVDVVDIELGGVGKSGEGFLGKLGGTGKTIERGLEAFYKGGDNIFKLEDAWYNYKQLSKEIGVLNDGEWMEFDIKGKGRLSRLERTPEGYTLDGKSLTKNQLDDILSRVSSQPGRSIFVDYSDIPNAVKWLRASKALGVTSPFFSWAWQVMDIPIPGIGKKGIGAHALTDRAGYRTNSKALNAVKVSKAAITGIRRQVLISAMREAILAEDDETLRKILAYAPKEFNLQLLELTGSPFYIGHDSMESANQFGPSDAILRAIMAVKSKGIYKNPALAVIGLSEIDDEELKKIYMPTEDGSDNIDYMLETVKDPKMKREIIQRRNLVKKQLSGEGFTAGDTLNLIGLSGSPIMDAVVAFQEADRQGKVLDATRLWQTATTAIMGGTAARTLEIGLAGLFPKQTRAFTTRKWAENTIDKPSEDFMKWSMRRLTGLGFRPIEVGKRSKWYWINKGKEWKATLTKDLRSNLRDPSVPITGTERDNINERIIEIEKIVDAEMMFEKLHFQKVLQKIGKPKE